MRRNAILSLCVVALFAQAGVDAKPQPIPVLRKKSTTVVVKPAKQAKPAKSVPFKKGVTKSPNGEWRINGVITGVNLPAWTMTMTDGNTGYQVVVQRTTQLMTSKGQAPTFVALNPGDEITLVGLAMDDGRILATKINLVKNVPPNWEPVGDPVGATAGLYVSNLHGGMVVPPIFRVEGKAKPRSWVRVTVHSTHPLTPDVVNTQINVFNVDGRADGLGKFSIPIRADNEPPGSRMLLEVLTGDTFGNRSGPVMVSVLRQ